MPIVIEKVVQTFRQTVQFANPVSANILSHEDGKILSVATVWSQNNIERKTKMSSDMFQSVDLETKKVTTLGCSETSGHLVSSYSPSNLLRALVREVPAAGKIPKKQYIEVWKGNLMFKQFDLQSADLHGDLYTDSDFGCFEWSLNEQLILYVAEKKQPKTESFLSTKTTSDTKDSVTKGNEFLFTQDWGEQQVGKCKSVLVVADLIKDEVRLIDVKEDQDYFYGSGSWAPGGGVLAVAYVVEPTRLGRVFCTNRPSYIVHISPEGELTKLSDEGKSVFGPKLSPDNSKLIWFQREVGGPHHSCVSLIKYDWDKREQTTVVDVVLDETNCTGGQVFYGLYNHLKPSNCWLPDNKVVILSTPQRASIKTYAIDTELCSITEIAGSTDEEFSQGVLQVWQDYVICWRSSLKLFPGVYIAKLNTSNLECVDWIPLVPCKNIEEDRIINILRLEGEISDADSAPLVKNYSAIYFGPKKLESNNRKIPLIVWSHGGPHSSASNIFNMLAHFFTNLGFGILLVNYRGSIGAGKNSVDYLLGKVGYTDVSDVHLAHQHVLKSNPFLDEKMCFLYGGSHGGFLTLHLAGQYPDDFISCTALNPVTNLTQFGSSDIPDWAFVENGLNYSPLARLSSEETERLWRASPQYYVDKVKIPVLLLIGSKDLRVPPYHGINYYYALKEYGKAKTKLLLYEDNHPLAQSAHETDFILNTAYWFLDSIHHYFDE